MILETKSLLLREMIPDDFQALLRVLGDPETMCHYSYTFDGQHVRDWIERNMNRYRKDGFGLWAVCLKDNGEMIGDCGLTLQNINGEILPEIGPSAIGRFGIRIIRPCILTVNIPMYPLSGRRNPSGCVLPANIRMKSTEKLMYP